MEQSDYSKTTLILGFFDGIHLGHKRVIESAVDFARKNNSKTILLTFPKSPAEYFGKNTQYIYERLFNYETAKSLGVDFVIETDFAGLVNISASDYLRQIIEKYSPIAIFSGFNYSFGRERYGDPSFLKENQNFYKYEYFCIEPVLDNETPISSTYIKSLLGNSEIEKANRLLYRPFSLEGTVIKGTQTGRTIGFPTANIKYPDSIIQIPYGVYKINVFGSTAILNWGLKPTVGGKEPTLEIYIPNFDENIYGKTVRFEVLKKIRDEKKFNSLLELQAQIKEDLKECLK